VTNSVLVVDDYEPWRRRIAAELKKSGRWHVVGECVDGGDAVTEAAARKPDVIILDIGLKTMNGIEAARRILAADPNARILFLTGQQSSDVADAALATGARGYLMKPEAGGTLLRALEAVAAGARFVSPGLPRTVVDAITPPANDHRHRAVFGSRETVVDEFARFVESGLTHGRTVVVIAPRTSHESIYAWLEARGVSVGRAIDEGRYQAHDVDSSIEQLMPGGRYDRERVREAAHSMLDDAAKVAPAHRVAVCGEIAPRLWKDGRADIAIDIERLWNRAVTAKGADLLCGYVVDDSCLADGEYSVFREICGVHPTVCVR
jgi:DNA-binding NarL/FixJ family response regulator